MKLTKNLFTAAILCLSTAVPAIADGSPGQISNQKYHGGKYSGGQQAHVLANCPREYRGMYRGDLYCRKPEYQVLAYRHQPCPEDVWGMYRGDLYCVGRK